MNKNLEEIVDKTIKKQIEKNRRKQEEYERLQKKFEVKINMSKNLEERIDEVIKKQVDKDIEIDGKKYKSIVSTKTVKSLYDKIYELLASEFNEDVIKEKLKIEKDYTERETLAINLYKNSNQRYRFIPIEENNEKVMYCKISFLEAHEKNILTMLTRDRDAFFELDELLDTFKRNEFGSLKEGRYLEIKNDNYLRNMYIKARNFYATAMVSKEGWRKTGFFESKYYENSLFATRVYLDEMMGYEIDDKEFLAEVYAFRFEAEYLEESKLKNSKCIDYLKKAMELSPGNQNVLVTALRAMVTEFGNSEKAFLLVLLDYLVEEIKKLDVSRESVYYEHEMEILNDVILLNSKNKKLKKTQLDKVIKIYEIIFKKMEEVGLEKYEEVDVYIIKEFIRNLKV